MDEQDPYQAARDKVAAQLARVEAAHRAGARAGSQFRHAAEDRLRVVDAKLASLRPRIGHDDSAAATHADLLSERAKLHKLFALESQA